MTKIMLTVTGKSGRKVRKWLTLFSWNIDCWEVNWRPLHWRACIVFVEQTEVFLVVNWQILEKIADRLKWDGKQWWGHYQSREIIKSSKYPKMKSLCQLIPFACPFLDHHHDGLFFSNPQLLSRSFSPLTILTGWVLWSQHGEIFPTVILALITAIFNYFVDRKIFALFESVQTELSFRCSLFTFSTNVKLQWRWFICHSSK